MLYQQAPQSSQPFVVTVIKEPVPHTTIMDVIFGSMALTAVLVAAALVLGGLLAVVLIRWNRSHPSGLGHMPSVSPLVAPRADRSSSPTR